MDSKIMQIAKVLGAAGGGATFWTVMKDEAKKDLNKKKEYAAPFLARINEQTTQARDQVSDNTIKLEQANHVLQYVYRQCKESSLYASTTLDNATKDFFRQNCYGQMKDLKMDVYKAESAVHVVTQHTEKNIEQLNELRKLTMNIVANYPSVVVPRILNEQLYSLMNRDVVNQKEAFSEALSLLQKEMNQYSSDVQEAESFLTETDSGMTATYL